MAENDTPVAAPLTFDQWREAIQANLKGRDEYKKIRADLKLADAGKELGAEFNDVLEGHLSRVSSPAIKKDIRDALEFAHEICPNDPWRGAFITWLKSDPAAAALISEASENSAKFTYHGFIGDLCEAYGQALAQGEHPVISPYFNKEAPNAVQYKARLADGSWQDISQQELVALARKKDGPNIVHSANHAFLDSEASDLDSLQGEFSKLFDGSRLPVQGAEQAPTSGHLSTWNAKNLGPNDTITVFATNTRANRFLNLAQLFHRLHEVDANQHKPKDDTFQHVAPIAVDMVETLLKSIVVDSDVEKIKAHKNKAGKTIFFDESITLRADAMDIIRRQRYRGFSKGGNDFRDGMRLLVHALDSRDAGGKEQIHVTDERTNEWDLVHNMSVIVFGLNEKPMADYYREHGVTVPIVSSKNDITAPPSVRHEADEPAYNYNGNATGDGHRPDYSVKGMLADWRIHDLLKMHGAVSQGQAAITDVDFVVNDDGSYDPNTLSLEVAHGTTDAMMDKVKAPLNDALHAAGLTTVDVVRVGDGQGRNRYALQGEGLVSIDNVEKVQAVLRSLSQTHKEKTGQSTSKRPDMPLWVSEATAYEKISGMKRYLTLEEKGKLDQKTPYPLSVIDPASVSERVRFNNAKDLRDHARTMRNQEHPRIAETPSGERAV